jgi:hypothetical protein
LLVVLPKLVLDGLNFPGEFYLLAHRQTKLLMLVESSPDKPGFRLAVKVKFFGGKVLCIES